MRRKKKFKKRILRKFNAINLIIAIVSVLASFMIVSVSGSVQEYQTQQSSRKNLLYSAKRLADAFDFYNEKRFAKE